MSAMHFRHGLFRIAITFALSVAIAASAKASFDHAKLSIVTVVSLDADVP
jgi:hypothetical protein